MDPPKRDEMQEWVSAGQEAKLLPCRKLGVATLVSDPGYWVAAAHLLLLSIMPQLPDQDEEGVDAKED